VTERPAEAFGGFKITFLRQYFEKSVDTLALVFPPRSTARKEPAPPCAMPRADHGSRPCILAYKRTYFANLNRQLSSVDPTLMAAATLSACIAEAQMGAADLAGVVYGNVYSAGLRQNPARRVLAHIARSVSDRPESVFSVPAMSINSVCNSSGEAVIDVVRRILCGEGEIYAAGGFESMSHASRVVTPAWRDLLSDDVSDSTNAPEHQSSLTSAGANASTASASSRAKPGSTDSLVLDGLIDSLSGRTMGALADAALSGRISRTRSDEYAKASYEKRLQYLHKLTKQGADDPTTIGLYASYEGATSSDSEEPGVRVPPVLTARNIVYSSTGMLHRLSGEVLGPAPRLTPGGQDSHHITLPPALCSDPGENGVSQGLSLGQPGSLRLAPVLLSDTQLERYAPEKIPKLPPCFSPDGLNTAATSSAPCDGAATLLLASRAVAESSAVSRVSELIAYASVACHPENYALAPAEAIRTVLRQAGLAVDDVSRFRINEAFSGVPLFCVDELGIDPSRLNVTGDALAIGHPLGVSSCRALGDVHSELSVGEYGVASACNGGGGAVAFLIRRIR